MQFFSVEGTTLYFEASLSSFIHEIFEQNFYPYVTDTFSMYKAHTFS